MKRENEKAMFASKNKSGLTKEQLGLTKGLKNYVWGKNFESKATEIEVDRVYRMFNHNNGNPICNLCGINVKDNEDVWEDHLVNAHGYKIVSNMRDRDVDIDFIDGSDVPTSGIYE